MIRRRWRRRLSSEANCREVGRALQSYLDGDVEPDFAAKIGEHLEKCKDCGLAHSTYKEIKQTLADSASPADTDAVARLREFGRQISGN